MNAPIVAAVSRWCRLMLAVALLAVAVATAAAPGTFKLDSLNFVNAEISTVLKALADISGSNIVIAPDVKGQITVKLHNVSVDEALNIITRMSNLSYGVTNGTFIVSSKGNAATMAVVAQEHLIVKLKYLAPADAIAALGVAYRDIACKEIDQRLVLSGEGKRLKEAQAFIDELDIPSERPQQAGGTSGTPVAPLEIAETIYRVKALVPWQAKQHLEQRYSGDGLAVDFAPSRRRLEASAPAPAAGTAVGDAKDTVAAKAAPQGWQSDELILRGPKDIVEMATEYLDYLDVEEPTLEKRCSVKRIYASQAIAYLLERYERRGLSIITAPMNYVQITEKAEESKDAAASGKGFLAGTVVRRQPDGTLNIAEPIGDFIINGPEEVVAAAERALATIDVGPERVERILTVRYLQVEEAVGKLKELYSKDGLQVSAAPARRGSTPKVVENQATSESSTSDSKQSATDIFDLIVRGPENVVAQAEAMLARLDAEPAQIAINTEIVSINAGEVKNLGVVWGGNAGGVITPGSVSVGLNEQQSGDPLEWGRVVRVPISLNATINALETANKAKVISRPSTVVQNGREAFIHVGEQTYYDSVSGYTQTGPVFTTNIVNTGVTLKVRPQMSKDGVITLEITSNVADKPTFRTGVSGAQLPSYQENASTTVVQVRNNETLVIGGLTQSRQQDTRTAIPVLSKIPLIGSIFKSKQSTPSQTELLILVTPKVLQAGLMANPAAETPAVAQ